ncbi:DUF7285 family protein [Halodesulfurarchaeum sp.]|uniref:DUF7285 family protein n=1 Tax=Halodesulfurarchaeum sp. TaxID=1980530 RepID=UPI001BC1EE4C|nr:hypothetical protein [Halodesulfurarchaeum sp.]
MFSSPRRAQVEPLPALLGLAVFAIGVSLYGGTLADQTLPTDTRISDATMTRTVGILSEGSVVVPDRLDDLDGALPQEMAVTLRADGRTWHWGTPPDDAQRTRLRHVLIRSERGEVPGVLRVDA